MIPASNHVPDDKDALKAALIDARAKLSGAEAMIAHLQLVIAKMKREMFGPRSERSQRLIEQLELQLEDAQRVSNRPFGGWRILIEEFEVLAEVENVEEFLVLTRSEQIRAQPGAAPEHLPELGLRADDLEENEVHHFWYVDSGVEHIYRDRNVRRLIRQIEIIKQ